MKISSYQLWILKLLTGAWYINVSENGYYLLMCIPNAIPRKIRSSTAHRLINEGILYYASETIVDLWIPKYDIIDAQPGDVINGRFSDLPRST